MNGTSEFPTLLPAPLTPADCDLKDFPGTMIYRHRLRGSTFNATATDSEFRAGLNLWLNSQDQVPAGSLPDNDIELCRLADLGREIRKWTKVKAVALRGWFLCSDSRLYNRVVAEVVNAQWETKLSQRNKTLKARIAALEKHQANATDSASKEEIGAQLERLRRDLRQWQSRSANSGLISCATDSVTDVVTGPVTASKRREEKGSEGKGVVLVPLLRNGQADALPPDGQSGKLSKADPWAEVYKKGRDVLGDSAGGTITQLRQSLGESPNKVLGKLCDAATKEKPREWIYAFLVETAKPGTHVAGGRFP